MRIMSSLRLSRTAVIVSPDISPIRGNLGQAFVRTRDFPIDESRDGLVRAKQEPEPSEENALCGQRASESRAIGEISGLEWRGISRHHNNR
jgi:hypothetical protein